MGRIPDKGLIGRVVGGSDGIVSFESAHLDNVTSEIVVNADHLALTRHPLSVLEVHRILLEHLAEARRSAHRAVWSVCRGPPRPRKLRGDQPGPFSAARRRHAGQPRRGRASSGGQPRPPAAIACCWQRLDVDTKRQSQSHSAPGNIPHR